MVNYTKKAVKGASLVFIFSIVSAFLSYILRIVLARGLSPEEYGLFFAIFTFFMFFLLFRDLGLGNALIKYVAEYQAKKDYSKIKTLIVSTFLFQIISTSIIVLILLSISSFLSENYFKSPAAQGVIWMLVLYTIFSLLFRNARAILNGFQDVKWYAIAESLRVGWTILLSIVFLYFGYSVMSPALGFTFGILVAFLTLSVGLVKYRFLLKHKIKDFWKTSKQLLAFGLPSIFAHFGGNVIIYLDILILTLFVPLSIVGVYNVLVPTALQFMLFGASIATVLFPMVSELWSKGDKEKVSRGLKLIYTYPFIAVVPFFFVLIVYSDIFIRIVFGDPYAIGILAFRILLVAELIHIISSINYTALAGIGKPGEVAKIVFYTATINTVLNLFLIPTFGMLGAASSTAISHLFAGILSTSKLSKFVRLLTPWQTWIKLSVAGTLFVLPFTFLNSVLSINIWLKIALCLPIAGMVYLVSLKVLRVLDVREIKFILRQLLVKP